MSTINLLPKDYVAQRLHRRLNLACGTLFAVVVVAIIGAYLVSDHNQRRTERVREQVDAKYEEATKLIQRMQTLEMRKTTMVRKAESTSSLMERVPRSTLLGLITKARPKYTSLLEVKLETTRAKRRLRPGESKSPTGTSVLSTASPFETGQVPVVVGITVRGLAATDSDVARFIANLARSPLFEVPDLGFTQTKDVPEAETPLRLFEILIRLKPNADAIDLFPDRKAGKTAETAADLGPEQRTQEVNS